MSNIDLLQGDADNLISMQKYPLDNNDWVFPSPGGMIKIPLTSLDGRENFILDVNRNIINLTKITYQNRARVIYQLVRLDLNGSPHRNPDLTLIPCPHLHIYKEGYGDKWAYILPDFFFRSIRF